MPNSYTGLVLKLLSIKSGWTRGCPVKSWVECHNQTKSMIFCLALRLSNGFSPLDFFPAKFWIFVCGRNILDFFRWWIRKKIIFRWYVCFSQPGLRLSVCNGNSWPPIIFSLVTTFNKETVTRSRIHGRTISLRFLGIILRRSQTWGFRIQCLHYKPVVNHFCWGVGGGE